MSFSEQLEAGQTGDMTGGSEQQVDWYVRLQRIAVQHGAQDVAPEFHTNAEGDTSFVWPASGATALDHITYWPCTDMLVGWQMGPVPAWEHPAGCRPCPPDLLGRWSTVHPKRNG